MKKVVLVLGMITMALSSCKKEEITPTNSNETCTSSCGTIINDGIDNGCYWLEIQNSKTNAAETIKRFALTKIRGAITM
jgi:hypothetical protein